MTGRIYEHLASHFSGRVFKDVDSIPLGADFRTAILALQGLSWVKVQAATVKIDGSAKTFAATEPVSRIFDPLDLCI